MMEAEDLPFLVAVGTAQIAKIFLRSARAGPVQSQSDETAVVEGFVALGLMDSSDRRLTSDGRVEPFGEITKGIIAEAPGNFQGARRAPTKLSMARKAARRSSLPRSKAHSKAGAGMRPALRPSPGARK